MKTVGIIAEYNPFHNGHAYHIAKAKEVTGADYCIVVLGGDFTQRGLPAMMGKSLRAHAALLGGADLVIELPIAYSTGSAEYFAHGAVSLLDKLCVVDTLCFGSECGNLDTLMRLADALLAETPAYKEHLKRQLKFGQSYPLARYLALKATAPQLEDVLPALQEPNNILGIEYLKALRRRKSKIMPITIPRIGAHYNSSDILPGYSSASALRRAITIEQAFPALEDQFPDNVYALMKAHLYQCFPIEPEDICCLLPYKVMLEKDADFTKYFDINQDFSNRLRKALSNYNGFTSLCGKISSGNETQTGIARKLAHILLDIYQTDIDHYRKDDYIYYARILGFRKASTPLLKKIKAKSHIPLLSKLADANSLIPDTNGQKMLLQDINASKLYDLLIYQRFHQETVNEYQKEIMIL